MKRQCGVALISAIFLIVVLAALALYMVTLSGTQHFTAMWAGQGARAHYAAHSALQWGIWQALNGGSCASPPTIDGGSSSGFDIVVSCSSSNFDELGSTRTLWTITARASRGSLGSPDFVQRTQRATVVQ